MERHTGASRACILGDSPVAPFGIGGRARLARQLGALGIAEVQRAEEATCFSRRSASTQAR